MASIIQEIGLIMYMVQGSFMLDISKHALRFYYNYSDLLIK